MRPARIGFPSPWKAAFALFASFPLSMGACIAPSVLAPENRATVLDGEHVEWAAGDGSTVPGTYVSTEISGRLATVLRKVVYLFQEDGAYTGAALVDGDPPRFEVIGGRWRMEGDLLYLDDAPPAVLSAAPDGSLRLSGEEGSVVLRREAQH